MIVLDVEASGLEPKEHSILSIGAIDLDNPTNQFYDECRIWEGAKIDLAALAVNGFSEQEARSGEKKHEAGLIRAFIAWATDKPANRTLAAQNVMFDYEIVRAACARAHEDFPFAKRTIDTHTLAWGHMRSRGITPPLENKHSALSMTAVLAYCGLPEEPKPHNALTGALLHAEIVSRLAYNQPLLPDYRSYPIPWQ